MVIFIIFTALIYLLYLNKKNERRLIIKSIIIGKKEDFMLSLIVLILFFIFYVIFIKILKIFTSKNTYISFTLNSTFDIKLNIILLLVILYLILFSLRKNLFLEVRFHFLRLHYFVFLRFKKYRVFFDFFKKLDLNIFEKLKESKKKFMLYYFLLKYGFKIYAIITILYCYFFNDKNIYIGFLPYFSLYYFFFRIYNYLGVFEPDFERGMVQIYYPMFITTRFYGKYKLFLYKNKVIFGYSEFIFLNSIIWKYNEDYPTNFIFNFSYHPWYSGIDIYEIAENNKPLT